MFITQKKLDERIKQELEALEESLKKQFEAQREEIKQDFVQAIKDYLEKEKKLRYDSDEPYVSIVGERVAEDGTIEFVLDWNRAFIRKLQANGYRASSEDAMVHMWLATLSRQISDEAIAKDAFK